MEPTNTQMLLIISFFTLNLFNQAQGIDISLASSDVPSSQPVSSPQSQATPSPAPSNVPNMQPVSSPDQAQPAPSSRPNSASKPIEYITYQLPFSWSSKPKFPSPSARQSSAPSPSPNPSAEGSSTIDPSTEMITKVLKTDPPPQPTNRNTAAASATNPEVKRICDTTDHADLCVSFITPFFAEKSDIYSVLEMAMKACARQIRMAVTGIVKLARAKEIHFGRRSNLDDCKDSYDDALENIQNAMDAIPNRDIGTITTMLSAAVTDFSDCDDFTAHFPFMAHYDDKLTKLVSNCLAIASSIK